MKKDVTKGILDCGANMQHCMVDAILIDDKNQRIEAALKCIITYTDCLGDLTKDLTKGDIRLLQKEREKLVGRKRRS